MKLHTDNTIEGRKIQAFVGIMRDEVIREITEGASLERLSELSNELSSRLSPEVLKFSIHEPDNQRNEVIVEKPKKQVIQKKAESIRQTLAFLTWNTLPSNGAWIHCADLKHRVKEAFFKTEVGTLNQFNSAYKYGLDILIRDGRMESNGLRTRGTQWRRKQI